MSITFAHNCIILDASCIISLYASGQMEGILQSIQKSVAVAAFVFNREALWIYGGPDEDVKQTREKIELQPFVDAGLLKVVTIASETEAQVYVNLSIEIDDGEAVTGAIAIHRNWAIGVDDKKARSLFQREAAYLQLAYTLELVKHWADITEPSLETISRALIRIQDRAAYEPGQNHPLYSWWMKYRNE